MASEKKTKGELLSEKILSNKKKRLTASARATRIL